MGKRSPSPPPAPDYTAAAQAQGQANLDAARLTARLSNPNVTTPLGSQTVTFGRPTFNEQGYNQAMAAYNQQLADYEARKAAGVSMGPEGRPMGGGYDESMGFRPNVGGGDFGGPPVAPTREAFTTYTDLDTPYITQTLTPEAQATFEAQQRVERALAGLGEQGIGVAQQVLSKPFQPNLRNLQTELGGYGQVSAAPDLFGLGRAQGGFTPQQMPGQLDITGMGRAQGVTAREIAAAPDLMQYGQARGGVQAQPVEMGMMPGMYGFAQGGGIQGPQLPQLNLGGLPGLQYQGMQGIAGGDTGYQRQLDVSGLAAMPINAGQTAQNVILSRLQPQLNAQRESLRTQLINQGITPGSEAWRTAMQEQAQSENDATQQAALQGLQLDMAARAQGFGERQAMGQFANLATGQSFGQQLAAQQAINQARAQGFGEQQAIAGLGAQAEMARYNAAMQQQDAYNRAVQQNFGMGMDVQQARNAASQQLFAQQMAAQQAQNQAIAQNQAAALQQYQALLAGQQQGFGQQTQAAQLANQALAQNQQAALQQYQAALAGQQQGFGQQMDLTSLANAALAQNQATALNQQQAQNAAQQQMFNQALQAGQFGNTALQQSLAQQLALRSQPLNEIAALMAGAQVQIPQFQGYTGANVAPAPTFAATQAAGDFAQRNYQNQVNAYNARMGLYGSLGGAFGSYLGGR